MNYYKNKKTKMEKYIKDHGYYINEDFSWGDSWVIFSLCTEYNEYNIKYEISDQTQHKEKKMNAFTKKLKVYKYPFSFFQHFMLREKEDNVDIFISSPRRR